MKEVGFGMNISDEQSHRRYFSAYLGEEKRFLANSGFSWVDMLMYCFLRDQRSDVLAGINNVC
jgi:hypothetical protein